MGCHTPTFAKPVVNSTAFHSLSVKSCYYTSPPPTKRSSGTPLVRSGMNDFNFFVIFIKTSKNISKSLQFLEIIQSYILLRREIGFIGKIKNCTGMPHNKN